MITQPGQCNLIFVQIIPTPDHLSFSSLSSGQLAVTVEVSIKTTGDKKATPAASRCAIIGIHIHWSNFLG